MLVWAEERERLAADLAAHQEEVNRSRSFAQVLQELTQEFLRLRAMESRQQAGREFEPFLHRLFTLFDLEPTLAYNLKGEQIDGAIYYNTDHFVVEAKWLADTVEAEDLGRVRLDELISRKLLHASTTGNCYYPATEMLG